MKLDEYYKMVRLPRKIKSMRFDCIESTGNYEPFEEAAKRAKDGNFYFYLLYGSPQNFSRSKMSRKPNFTITDGRHNISGVFMPDDTVLKGYGDMYNTNDALLFQFSEDIKTIEIFISRGNGHQTNDLFTQFLLGKLDDEIKRLKENIKKDPIPEMTLFYK